MKLVAFVKMLNDRGIHKFNVNNFYSRLRLQKYVYLAKFFGFEHEYFYNLYLRGPYSSQLADDYYKLTDIDKWKELPEVGFNPERFIELVRGKDHNWLEIATTILFLWKMYKVPDRVIERTWNIKSHIGIPYIKIVFNELKDANLLN